MSVWTQILNLAASGNGRAARELLEFELPMQLRFPRENSEAAEFSYDGPFPKAVRHFIGSLDDAERPMAASRSEDLVDFCVDQLLSKVERTVSLIEFVMLFPELNVDDVAAKFTGWKGLKRGHTDRRLWIIRHLCSMNECGIALPPGSKAVQEALSSFTFADLADKYSAIRLAPAVYINGVRVSGRKECSSLKSAVKALRQHFGKKPIRLIKASDIENYKNVRIATPVITLINEFKQVYNPKTKRTKTVKVKVERHRARSIASVNRELQQFKAMLNFAIQNDWLIMNPFAKCKGIISTALETKRDRVLSYEEEERLLQACHGRRSHLRPILICALDTGMRRGEIFQMKWKDVDLSSRQIFIPQTNTKTQTARTVGITDRLKKELLRLWERSPKCPELIVFGISADVKNAWKSALQDADIENFRFHDCRHTATTRMIASGCHHTEVMKITGHSQMVTFLRYLNITPETAQRVADRLGNYLSSRSEISLDTPMSDYVN